MMTHTCFICNKEISEELAEAQNCVQPPGNYLSCERHTQQVELLNFKMRELQKLRYAGYSNDTLSPQIDELNRLKEQYRSEAQN